MSKVLLTKQELTALVLGEIRKCEGCDGVTAVVIMATEQPRAVANWQIAVVVDNRNPEAAHSAAAAVEQRLREKYQLS